MQFNYFVARTAQQILPFSMKTAPTSILKTGSLISGHVDVFIAVEPLSWPLFNDEGREDDPNCMIKLLPTKHRTCEPIDKFVAGAIREKDGLNVKSNTSGMVTRVVSF